MKIEFIIPAYKRPNELMMVLSSLCSQTNNNWSAHVIADGPFDGYQKVKDYYLNDERIRFTELNGPHNDWGHTPRNYGLEHAKEEWVIMTGDDNYYVPVFVDFFLKEVTPDVNFVYCDMVHNMASNNYLVLKTEPIVYKIDMGCFMSKTENAKQMKLDVTKVTADGLFVVEYLKKFPGKTKHIEKLLYVHN